MFSQGKASGLLLLICGLKGSIDSTVCPGHLLTMLVSVSPSRALIEQSIAHVFGTVAFSANSMGLLETRTLEQQTGYFVHTASRLQGVDLPTERAMIEHCRAELLLQVT